VGALRFLVFAGPTRLGFAVLPKFFQYAARFPFSMQEVPTTAVAYIAGQVGVPAEEFSRYDWEGRAVKYHRAQIRTFLGFREPTVQDAGEFGRLAHRFHVTPYGTLRLDMNQRLAIEQDAVAA
jgi:hypothetical protein